MSGEDAGMDGRLNPVKGQILKWSQTITDGGVTLSVFVSKQGSQFRMV